jgi:hypothetical protein
VDKTIKPLHIIQNDTKCKIEKYSLYMKIPTIKERVGATYCKKPIQYKVRRFVPALNNKRGKEVITPVKIRNTLIFVLVAGNARVVFWDRIIKYPTLKMLPINISSVNEVIGGKASFFFNIPYMAKLRASVNETHGKV